MRLPQRLRRWHGLPSVSHAGPGARLSDRGLGMVALAAIVVFALSLVLNAFGLAPIAVPLHVVFLQIGPGLALCLLARVRSAHRLILFSAVSGTALLAMTATAMAWNSWWRVEIVAPVWTCCVLLALLAVVIRAVVDQLHPRPPSHAQRAAEGAPRHHRPVFFVDPAPWRSVSTVVVVLTMLGLGLAVGAAWWQQGPPQPAGMALTAGPVWFAGVLLMLGALVLSILREHRLLALTVPVITTMVVLSQAMMYGLPTVIVAGRHVGIGDYVGQFGALRPDVDIYQAWVGLFASTAFTAEAVPGFGDPLIFATWWAVVGTPLMVLAVRAAAGRLLSPSQAWIAGLIFGLANSLNTPFYAPQVYGFVAAFALLALFLGPERRDGRSTRLARIGLGVIMSCGLAITHQLSPYMLTAAVGILLLARILYSLWILAVVFVPPVSWALINIGVLDRYISPEAFGQLTENLAPPSHPAPPIGIPLANTLTFQLPAGLLVLVGLAAMFVIVRRWDRLGWGLAFTAGSPVVLMLATDYGSEGIFRVALFALPWLAILASQLSGGGLPNATPADRERRTRWWHVLARARLPRMPYWARIAAASLTSLVMLTIHVVGMTGMDWARVMRHDDVAVMRTYERTAADGSLLLFPGSQLGTAVALTSRYFEVDAFGRDTLFEWYRPREIEVYPLDVGPAYDADADLARLTDILRSAEATERYAMVSDSGMGYNARYGLLQPSDYQKLREAFVRSDDWELVAETGTAQLFRLRQ